MAVVSADKLRTMGVHPTLPGCAMYVWSLVLLSIGLEVKQNREGLGPKRLSGLDRDMTKAKKVHNL